MIDKIIQIAGAIIATASTIIAILKAKKAGKKEKFVKLAKVVQQIPELICKAEKAFGNETGEIKLSYVLTELYIKCLQEDIEFDKNGLTAEIEKILETPQKKQKGE